MRLAFCVSLFATATSVVFQNENTCCFNHPWLDICQPVHLNSVVLAVAWLGEREGGLAGFSSVKPATGQVSMIWVYL